MPKWQTFTKARNNKQPKKFKEKKPVNIIEA